MKDLGEMTELVINYLLKNSHNSASPSTIETLFISLRGKKGKKLIRSSNKSMFLQGDVTQLTTILPRSK